jgi:predicted alpha/beta superfamily hydrolase
MKFLAILFCGAALLAAPLQSTPAAEPRNEQPFVLNEARHFNLKSQTNGRAYQIFVMAPRNAAPPEGFPVIYAVDGNAMFPLIAANAHLLRMNTRAVFVGIGYPGDAQFDTGRRYFDFTPVTPDEVVRASGRSRAARETGGHDLFIEFIEKEVKPLIEKRHKINRQKQTLFGHSLGGLFTLHVLFSRPETFQNYVTAAPSTWWNDGSILGEHQAFLEKHKNQKLSLNALITNNTDPTRRRPTPDQAQGNNQAQSNAALSHLRNARHEAAEKLDDIAASLKTIPGVVAEYRVFENESHISMAAPSINSALRFVLGEAQRSQAAPPPDAARGGENN